LGSLAAKGSWQNPRWRPFKIKRKMPSTPSPNEYLSFELIFYPCWFSLDNTFHDLFCQMLPICTSEDFFGWLPKSFCQLLKGIESPFGVEARSYLLTSKDIFKTKRSF
jgi:hypothetical protein